MARACACSVTALHSSLQLFAEQGLEMAPAYGHMPRMATLIRSVAALTGRSDAHCGSAWALRHLLGTGGRVFRLRARHWCARCYAEWDSQTSYEPLAWSLPYLARCPIHSEQLHSHCQACGSAQGPGRSYDVRRSCSSCGASLASDRSEPRSRSSSERLVDAIVLDIAGLCADPELDSIPFDRYSTLREEVFQSRAAALLSYTEWHHLRRRLMPNKGPNFGDLIRISAFLGPFPSVLLRQPDSGSQLSLFETPMSALPLLRDVALAKCRRAVGVMRLMRSRPSRLLPADLIFKHIGIPRGYVVSIEARDVVEYERLATLPSGQSKARLRIALNRLLFLAARDAEAMTRHGGAMLISQISTQCKISTAASRSLLFRVIRYLRALEAIEGLQAGASSRRRIHVKRKNAIRP